MFEGRSTSNKSRVAPAARIANAKDLGADFWGRSRLHAYATANIVDLQLLFAVAGLEAAAAVLRCTCSFPDVAFVSNVKPHVYT